MSTVEVSGLFKHVRLGQVRKTNKKSKSYALGPQSICWPVLDENLKERFLKERPRPISSPKNVQPSLSTTNALGTKKTWLLYRGGHY